MRTIHMTPEILCEAAISNGGFETAALNDSLYLHFKGFSRIENLEPYSGLKALWLESNGLEQIENLEAQTKLRCLYLQQNLISKVENLESLVSLRILDLSQNRLLKLENLGCLPLLQTLNVSKNLLADNEAICELVSCRALTTVDLSANSLDGEGIMKTIAAVPGLLSLSLTGNPVMSTPQLRKKMICAMPSLTYLDRPIFEAERFASEAWGRGGREEEVAARSMYQDRQRAKASQEAKEFREWKAAKIAERTKVLRVSPPKLVSAAPQDPPNPERPPQPCSEEAETDAVDDDQGFNISKLSHELENKVDVSSFRAPSYVPDEVDYDNFPPPPSPPPPTSATAKSPVPPTLPPPYDSYSGTDFNELD